MPIKMQEYGEPWYTNGIYRRFWRHYSYTMNWMQWHRVAYWKAKAKAEAYENMILMNYFQNVSLNCGDQDDVDFHPNRAAKVTASTSRAKPYSYSCQTRQEYTQMYKNKVVTNKKENGWDTRKLNTQESEEVIFEITDDMLAFLEKSDQHRKELRAQRAAEELLEIDEKNKDCRPPKEQKGARRTAEMKFLYGKQTALIHGMETAVQMQFNRNCDDSNPKLWPNIPLKLIFEDR